MHAGRVRDSVASQSLSLICFVSFAAWMSPTVGSFSTLPAAICRRHLRWQRPIWGSLRPSHLCGLSSSALLFYYMKGLRVPASMAAWQALSVAQPLNKLNSINLFLEEQSLSVDTL